MHSYVMKPFTRKHYCMYMKRVQHFHSNVTKYIRSDDKYSAESQVMEMVQTAIT